MGNVVGMARILLANIPAYGLANPMLPLVRALADAGHEVDVLLSEPFRARVQACGAALVPYAGYLGAPITSPKHLLRHGRRLFADLDERIRSLGPSYDVVVAGGLQPRFTALQDALDVPVVFAPPVFLQNERVMSHLADLCTGLPAPARRIMRTPALRRVLARGLTGVFGVDVGDPLRLLGPISRSVNLVNTSRYHQPFDEDFTDRCVYYGPTATLPVADPTFPLDRLRSHPGPVIYATLGTVFNRYVPFFRTIADAFAGSEALVVIAAGNEANVAAIGPVADNVIVRRFVPQALVLEQADVCFTHGGFGSATDCAVLGVPPVLTPMGADQFFNAYRLAELDAGRVLPKRELSVRSVRRAADEALTSPYAGLAPLRASFVDAGGPAVAARAIEALL